MESFQLKGANGFIKITLTNVFGFPDRTCHVGGYDTEATIELTISGYSVNSKFWTTTGQLFTFYQALKTCHDQITGEATYENYESNLMLRVEYYKAGHTRITGEFRESTWQQNLLQFEISGDQSYLSESLVELSLIAGKYGDDKGIK
jgi:hypothetical protein